MIGDQFQAMRPNTSSLPFEICVYFNWHFAVFFFFLSFVLFIYKATSYHYPSDYLAWDYCSIFLYIFIEYVRLLFASKANKTAQRTPLVTSLILAIPIAVLHAYYIELQTYVLRVDIVLNAIAFCFIAFELVVSLHLLFTLSLAASRF